MANRNLDQTPAKRGPSKAPRAADAPDSKRRDLLRFMFGASIAGVTMSGDTDEDRVEDQTFVPTNELFNVPDPQETHAEVTEALILKIEAGMRKLAETAIPLIERIEDERTRNQLMAPFELIELNSENPHKNNDRFLADASPLVGGVKWKQEAVHWFSYTADGQANVVAGFKPPTREMMISPDFDPDNICDLLILFHELTHVAYDTTIRYGLQTTEQRDNYLEFHDGSTPKVELVNEIMAYSSEIDMMNLLTHDFLRATIEGGQEIGKVEIDDLMRRLNWPERDRGMFMMLLELAKLYYPMGNRIVNRIVNRNSNFEPEYVKHMAKIHGPEGRGMEVYVYDIEGNRELYDFEGE